MAQAPYRYRAFISYNHAADEYVAAKLQAGLQDFMRPFWRLRAIDVFRDRTDLGASPQLWDQVKAALDASEFLILLACPESAASLWVRREIGYWWATRKSLEKVIIVLTGGELRWTDSAFDPSLTSALPHTVLGPGDTDIQLTPCFQKVPNWVDMRWVRQSKANLSERNVEFQDAIVSIALPLHGRTDKRALVGIDVARHRTFRWVRNIAIAVVVALATAAMVFAFDARQQRRRAEDTSEELRVQRDRADSERLAAESQLAHSKPQLSTLLALAALDRLPPEEQHLGTYAARALFDSLKSLGGRPLGGHAKELIGLTSSPGGQWFFSWDPQNGLLRRFDRPDPPIAVTLDGGIEAAALSPVLPLLAVRTEGPPRLHLFDFSSGTARAVASLDDEQLAHGPLEFAASGDWLVAGNALLRVGPDAGTRLLGRLSEESDPIHDVAFDPGGRFVAASSGRRFALRALADPKQRWGVTRGDGLRMLGDDSTIEFSRTGRWLLSYSESSDLHVCSAPPGLRCTVLSLGNIADDHDSIRFAGFTAGDRGVIAVTAASTLRYWPLRSNLPSGGGTLFQTLEAFVPDAGTPGRNVGLDVLRAAVEHGGLDPSGRFLVVERAEQADVWDVTPSPRQVASLVLDEYHSSKVLLFDKLRLHLPAGKTHLASWDLSARHPEHTRRVLRGHEEELEAAVLGLDGGALVTAAFRSPTEIDEMARPELRYWLQPALRSHAVPIVVRSLDGAPRASASSFSVDGGWLVVGLGEEFFSPSAGTSIVIDVSNPVDPRVRRAITSHPEGIHDLSMGTTAFATSGGEISSSMALFSTSSYDPIARVWPLDDPTAAPLELAHNASVTSVRMSVDDRFVITTSGADRLYTVWAITLTDGGVGRIAGEFAVARFAPADTFCAVNTDGGLELWSAATGSVLASAPDAGLHGFFELRGAAHACVVFGHSELIELPADGGVLHRKTATRVYPETHDGGGFAAPWRKVADYLVTPIGLDGVAVIDATFWREDLDAGILHDGDMMFDLRTGALTRATRRAAQPNPRDALGIDGNTHTHLATSPDGEWSAYFDPRANELQLMPVGLKAMRRVARQQVGRTFTAEERARYRPP